jgi:hypothetical protein
MDYIKNKSNNPNNSYESQRMIDQLTQETMSWWGKSFIFAEKTRIKTWKAISIVAFFGGIATAVILFVSFRS